MRQFSLRTMSLRQKLPVLICLLLLAVMIIFTLVSYYSVRRVTVNNAKQRLQDISGQMTNAFGQSALNLYLTYQTIGSREEVKNFLYERTEELKPPVLAVMRKLADDTLIATLQLIDATNSTVLRNTRGLLESKINVDSLSARAIAEDTLVIGKLLLIDGQLYHAVKTSIRDKGKIIGHLLGWRKVRSTRAELDRFSKLLGDNASIYVGNMDKGLWTDLIGPTENPMPGVTNSDEPSFEYKNREGKMVMASLKSIPNTSWVFLVQFPRQEVLAPARTFLKWIIIIGALLNLIAIFVTWHMSQNLTRPLKELTAAATTIAGGRNHTHVDVNRYDEIGKLSRAFNTMSNKVSRSKEELEQKIDETQQMTGRLRELSAHLQNIREEERIHIAREMHDELGQLLTGFKMDVSWLHKKLGNTQDPVVKEKLEEMMEVVNEAARFVRKLASELRPSILDDLGLIPALDWHSQEFKRRSNINVEFRTSLEEIKTSKDIATGLFRIYQESLTNVARHAEAHKVNAELELVDTNIQLTITDDGRGFDTRTSGRKTLGLLGMKERAAMLGGQLRIYSAPGKGTTILISIPQHHSAYSEV